MHLLAPPELFIARSKRLINLQDFEEPIPLELLNIGKPVFNRPEKIHNHLRTPISHDGLHFLIPPSLSWLQDFIHQCVVYQTTHLTLHPYWYLTVRFETENERSSLWHVDGFSLRFPHVPETNYIYCSEEPTIFYTSPVVFPQDFDGKRHHVHHYLSEEVDRNPDFVTTAKAGCLYLLDPYMTHKRPDTTHPRLFIRLTNVPIQIEDDLFTPNPLFPIEAFHRIGRDIADEFETYSRNKM